METDKNNMPTPLPWWMKSRLEPVTDEELESWHRWASSKDVCTTRTGNIVIRLINTITMMQLNS